MKALAILLYGMGGMSFSMIGRVLEVSDVAVLKWVRAEAAALPGPVVSPSVVTVEVDEMWHFLRRGLPSSGSGAPDDLDQRPTVTPVSFADIPPGDRCATVLGGHDDATCRRLIDKIGLSGKTFTIDNWGSTTA